MSVRVASLRAHKSQWLSSLNPPKILIACTSKYPDYVGTTSWNDLLFCLGTMLWYDEKWYPDKKKKKMMPGIIFVHLAQKWYRVLLFEHHLISSQSLNLGLRRGITDDFATIPFHHSMSLGALRESPNSVPVHSLMLSSHLFFCLPLLLASFTVPCRTVFAMPEDLEMWQYHRSFRLSIRHEK